MKLQNIINCKFSDYRYLIEHHEAIERHELYIVTLKPPKPEGRGAGHEARGARCEARVAVAVWLVTTAQRAPAAAGPAEPRGDFPCCGSGAGHRGRGDRQGMVAVA